MSYHTPSCAQRSTPTDVLFASIQVDMNNRKSESKEEQNQLEQEIQDLNNRFTISLSDLKTEIEQNIKWDATRRSLGAYSTLMSYILSDPAVLTYPVSRIQPWYSA